MSEEKKKKNFDEQTLSRVLEAAYVLQEHQHELDELKSSLDSKRNGSNGAGVAATKSTFASPMPSSSAIASPASTPSPSPPPIASPPSTALPTSRSSTIVAASPSSIAAPLPTVSASPIAPAAPPDALASPVPRASWPVNVPEPLGAKNPDSVLAHVMEIQREVQVRHLDLDAAMSLVAEQVIEICGAAGAAIAIVYRRTVKYRSVAGIRTLPKGSDVPVEEALCASCLQSGEVWRCVDANSDNVMQREECRHRGIGSLIAAPLFHEGKSVGALELLFSDPRAFSEQDVQTCQLMAGIITEALSCDLRWKDAPAANAELVAETVPEDEATAPKSLAAATESSQCYRCGHTLLAGEQFCGECGTPRSGDYEPAGIQSKVASLWHMQQDRMTEPSAHVQLDELPPEPAQDAAPARLRTSILNLPDRPKRTAVPHFGLDDAGLHDTQASNGVESLQAVSVDSLEPKPAAELGAPTARTNKALEELISPPPPPVPADWSSATSARNFLEQLADGNQNILLRFWNTRRGDIYLAIAVILVACVIRWGIWSNRPESPKPAPAPTPAASAPQKSAELDLPLSERMLIAVGLADAPEPPADKGNPSTQVWVDLHTALYYCPGTDLYGKTATGKYTTQRDAELDQFQPAYRKTCN